MLGGLASGYGALAAIAARYLYPARPRARRRLFLVREAEVAPGDSVPYTTPDGRRLAVTRRGRAGTAEDFVALSSTCPHLGCQVHWEPARERFFCPCHNGAFDATGKAIAGPPLEAGQSLARYPLSIVDGLVYIEVEVPEARGATREA